MADTDVAIRLTAETQGFISGMERALGATDALKSGLSLLTNVAGALGVGLGVSAIVSWSREVISAAAALDDLSHVTGSSVENLSRLQNQAKVSGVEFGTLQSMIGKLAAGMAGADEESSNVGRALRALGVEAKDPAEAMIDVAKAMDRYADGVGKAAIAKDLFGRGGPQMVALLHDLAQAGSVAATVTRDQAEASDKLEKSLRQLSVESTTFKNTLLSEVVPALNRIIGSFNDARKAGLGFWESLKMSGNWTPDAVGKAINETASQMDRLKTKIAELQAQGKKPGWGGDPTKQIADMQAQLTQLQKTYQALGAIQARMQATDSDLRSREDRGYDPTRPQLDYKGGNGKIAKDKIDEYTRAIQQLREMAALADAEVAALFSGEKLTEADKFLSRITASDAWKTLNAAQQEAVRGAVALVAQQQRIPAAMEESRRAEEEFAKKWAEDEQKTQMARKETLDSLERTIEALRIETETTGMTAEAKERYVANTLLQKQYDQGLITTTEELARRQRELSEAFDRRDMAAAAQKSADEQKRIFQKTYDDISQTITDGLMRGFESGKDIAKNFVDTLKNLFGTLILRPTIQAIVAPFASALSGNAFGMGGAQGGMGGGGFLSMIGSGFAGTPFGYGLSNPFGFFSSMFGGASAMGPTLPELFGTGGMAMAGLGAAVPILGVLGLIGSLFGGGGGAPKQGGFASVGPRTPADRFFTPNDADSKIAGVLSQWQSDYRTLVASLGGKARSDISFSLGYDTDPGGTASNRISSQLDIGGQVIRSIRDRDIGGDIAAALAEETTAATILALQHSNLPAVIDRYWQQVTDATKEQLQDLVDVSVSLATVSKLQAGDPLKDARGSLQSPYNAFSSMSTALEELVTNFDGSAAAAKDLATATVAYYNAQVQLLAQIESVRQAISTMFGDTVRSLTLQTLTKPADRYNYLRAEATSLDAQIQASSDPDAIRRWAERINQDITEAFGLLSPEEQSRQLASYVTYTQAVDTRVNERLAAIETDVQQSAATVLQDVRAALDTAAQAMVDAAKGMQQAGSDEKSAAADMLRAGGLMVKAATTPIRLVASSPETNFG